MTWFLLFLATNSVVSGSAYYLSPSGTDRDDCSGGSRANPWKTWESARSNSCVSPGDTVYLMEGTYASRSAFIGGGTYLRIEGRGGSPIVMAADPRASGKWPARLKGEFDLSGGHFVLQGLEIYGDGGQPIETHCSHFTIRECWVHGRPEDVDVDGPKIKDDDCIKIIGGNPQYHDIEIIDNTICDCPEDAIDVTGARNLVYRGNHIYNARMMQVKGGTDNILIENNRIHTMHTGIIAYRMACSSYCGSSELPGMPVGERFAARDVVIRNNLIYDIRQRVAIGANGWKNVEIYHNTFYRAGNGATLKLGSTGLQFFDSLALDYCATRSCASCGSGCVYIDFPAEDVLFKNNIIHTPGTYAVRADGDAVSGFSAAGNVYYRSGGSMAFQAGGTDYRLLNFPHESNSYENNPGLTDVTAGDFTLSGSSFAVDKGVAAGLAEDIAGTSRDGTPDAGAYEYARPTNVRSAASRPPGTVPSMDGDRDNRRSVLFTITGRMIPPSRPGKTNTGCAACIIERQDKGRPMLLMPPSLR